ncbi:hypothetical protein [Sinorhizobium medicae]|uniref:hypothetical protein n=1 Tax=Sinorhizobium medicae TaxID=110321 RepID=UPI00138FE7A3|nr:hypothetical protein [Sinorhizobium medicae]
MTRPMGGAHYPVASYGFSQEFGDYLRAVIAIENVRLFQEVQARTEELSRSLKDLRTAQDRLIQAEKLQLSHKAAGDDRRFYFEKCCRKRVLTSNSKTEKTSPTPDQTQWLNTHNGERPD